jgi:methylase of polypeptide subunit release factors
VTDATAYLAPLPRRRVRRPVLLKLTEEAYPLEPWAEEAWLAVAFRAFMRIAARSRVRDVLIVGTGNGLDALGAMEIFELRSLTVTELFERSLAVARENILGHLAEQSSCELRFHAGDVLSCVPAEARFDLVYENLPNVPATADVDLELGTNTGRFFRADSLAAPERFARHLLALHHRCLRQAWPHVRPGGGVLTAIGGRVPDEVVVDLHRACGYEPELVAFDVKLQGEPQLVIPGYSRVEAEGDAEFTFYDAEAVETVARRRRTGLEGAELADAVAGDLRRLSMSAREAERRSRRGEQVAHSVLMVLGRRPAERRSAT